MNQKRIAIALVAGAVVGASVMMIFDGSPAIGQVRATRSKAVAFDLVQVILKPRLVGFEPKIEWRYYILNDNGKITYDPLDKAIERILSTEQVSDHRSKSVGFLDGGKDGLGRFYVLDDAGLIRRVRGP